MTVNEILEGLKFRLANLEQGLEVISEEEGLEFVKADYESRIDEIESIIHWIKENE